MKNSEDVNKLLNDYCLVAFTQEHLTSIPETFHIYQGDDNDNLRDGTTNRQIDHVDIYIFIKKTNPNVLTQYAHECE